MTTMQVLWAPWRKKYLKKADFKKCLFCEKWRKKHTRKNFILEKGKSCFVMLNIFPYNNGHILIAPHRHIRNFFDLTEQETKELISFLKKYEAKLEKAFRPTGLNIGTNIGRAAGAGFAGHLHIHIVPRWEGDTNFMPVLGKLKVIPESLESVYKKIKNA